MMLQIAVSWVGSERMGHRALGQAELFWHACFNVTLYIYVYYVYFMSSAYVDSFISLLMPSEKGVLWISRKDGQKYVKLYAILPQWEIQFPCYFVM